VITPIYAAAIIESSPKYVGRVTFTKPNKFERKIRK
jgi:hypothetical protein